MNFSSQDSVNYLRAAAATVGLIKPQACTIMIPVFDETAALRFSAHYFSSLGITPLYVLDSKKIERKAEVEKIVGNKVAIYENPKTYVEANYDRLVAQSPTDMIVRIDCDEILSVEALKFVQRFSSEGGRGIVGFDRRQLRISDGRFEALDWQPYQDIQWRLINRRKVTFDFALHTAGIHVPALQRVRAPLEAVIYHLDFLFNNVGERGKKNARYMNAGMKESMMERFTYDKRAENWIKFDDPVLVKSHTKFLALE